MTYAELQQAIIDDTHKSQYAGATIQRMIAEGEALIAAHLESYNFLATLADANRIAVGSPIYTLPAGLVNLRYVRINGLPLDKVDETSVYLYASSNTPKLYAQRASQIIIAGTPALLTTIDIDYMGMPAALSTTPAGNSLLNDVPQLYKDATSVYVFRRAQDYESADVCMQSLVGMCAQLNRKSKKLLGGAQGAPAYNTNFRSAY